MKHCTEANSLACMPLYVCWERQRTYAFAQSVVMSVLFNKQWENHCHVLFFNFKWPPSSQECCARYTLKKSELSHHRYHRKVKITITMKMPGSWHHRKVRANCQYENVTCHNSSLRKVTTENGWLVCTSEDCHHINGWLVCKSEDCHNGNARHNCHHRKVS